jgi:hypothetical protein
MASVMWRAGDHDWHLGELALLVSLLLRLMELLDRLAQFSVRAGAGAPEGLRRKRHVNEVSHWPVLFCHVDQAS